jgi:hypothetical protein
MHKIKLFKYILVFFFLNAFVSVQAQTDCEGSLTNSQRNYNIGLFKEAINQLNYCLKNNGFKKEETIEAYKLLAMCHLAIDSVKNADSAIDKLLFINGLFEPTFNDPERFKIEISKIRYQQLKNLVSSVSKRPEELRLAPATISVITANDIVERGYNDIIDILKDIPGFDISVYYGVLYANAYQRGFRTNNTEKTLFLIDGVEDNSLWSNVVNLSQQYSISNIKQVEIIYGPASTMYGANAFSGVINIITKQPEDFIKNNHSSGVDVRLGKGTYNTRFADATYAYKKNLLSFSLTGRVNNSDRPDLSSQGFWDFDPSVYDNVNYGSLLNVTKDAQTYLTNNKLPLISPLYNVYGAVGKADSIVLTNAGKETAKNFDKSAYSQTLKGIPINNFVNPTTSSFIQAKLNISNFSIGFMQWYKLEGLGTLYTDKTYSLVGTNWSNTQSFINVNYNKQINNNLTISSASYYKDHMLNDNSEMNMLTNYATKGLTLLDLINAKSPYYTNTHYFHQSRQFRSELKINYTFNRNFYLVSGIEFRNTQLPGNYLTSPFTDNLQDSGTIVGVSSTSKGAAPSTIYTGGNQYDVTDVGAYAQGTYRTSKGFGFTLGARVDNNKVNKNGGFGTEFSPRVVFDYSTKTFVVKTIYSHGIMNVSNNTKISTVGTRVPNLSLNTEEIDNFELSFNKQFSKNLSADIDFYYSVPYNVVGLVNIAGGKQQNQNIGNFNIFGIQHNLNYTNNNFKATFNYTYCDPKQTKSELGLVNNTVADISDNHFNLILNYLLLKHININLRTNYVGTKKVGPNTTVVSNPEVFNPYTISNLTVGLFNVIKNTKISIVCNNLFDKTYYNPGPRVADGITNPTKVLQMQRNFMIRLNYEF